MLMHGNSKLVIFRKMILARFPKRWGSLPKHRFLLMTHPDSLLWKCEVKPEDFRLNLVLSLLLLIICSLSILAGGLKIESLRFLWYPRHSKIWPGSSKSLSLLSRHFLGQ